LRPTPHALSTANDRRHQKQIIFGIILICCEES
jgi:hypothetical protein